MKKCLEYIYLCNPESGDLAVYFKAEIMMEMNKLLISYTSLQELIVKVMKTIVIFFTMFV